MFGLFFRSALTLPFFPLWGVQLGLYRTFPVRISRNVWYWVRGHFLTLIEVCKHLMRALLDTSARIGNRTNSCYSLWHYTIVQNLNNPLCCPVIYFASATRSWNGNEKPQFKVYLNSNEEKDRSSRAIRSLCPFLSRILHNNAWKNTLGFCLQYRASWYDQ